MAKPAIHLRFSMRKLALLFLALPVAMAHASTRADLDRLSEAFWTWRAAEQPFTNDDIPRIERPAGFEVDWSLPAEKRYEKQAAEFEAKWRALDMSGSSVADRIDWRLLGSAIARARWELEVLPGWKRNPFFYVDQSLGSVYVALLPPPPIRAQRQEEILRRLEKIPSILQQGRQNLTDMRGPYVRASLSKLDSIEAAMDKFQTGLMPEIEPANRPRAEHDIAEAKAALTAFRDWIKSRQNGLPETTNVGRDAYLYFLRNIALVSYTPEQILAIGQEEWLRAVSFESLQHAANTGLPKIPLFPSVEEQCVVADKQEEEIRAYLVSHKIMSVPEFVKHYKDVPIPPYIEALAFMGVTDDLTGPDRLNENGVSYKGAPDKQTGFFKVVSAHDPRPLILHEGIPGHYFQMAWSWHHPDPIRRHYYDSESNEGIGYYAEEMMEVAGLFDNAPMVKEYIDSMMRLRALRVEVDVRLAMGSMTLEQAAHYLESTVPMDAETALHEASMFSLIPGQAITYTLGKHDIMRMMTDARQKQGAAFDLQKFHDFVYLNGNVPFSLQRWELLGDESQVPAVEKSGVLPRT